METTHPRILIAAPHGVLERLAESLDDDELEVLGAETWDEAVRQFHQVKLGLLVVCYVFDEIRPFRLLQYVQHQQQAHIPTLLVRALPIKLGTTEAADIRESYMALGVDEFINLHDEEEASGRAIALRRFRQSVLRKLASPPAMTAGV